MIRYLKTFFKKFHCHNYSELSSKAYKIIRYCDALLSEILNMKNKLKLSIFSIPL